MIDPALQETLTIDQIYEKVKDKDLVLTADAALADALNARLNTAHIGPFATTPRRLALDNITVRKKLQKKRDIFLEILNEGDLNWKQASYLLENIVNCWMETGESDTILKHDRYDTKEVKNIIDILKKRVNPYSSVERYTVPKNVDLAVVAPHQFTELDKKVLPPHYDVILPFKNTTSSLPEFHIFHSSTEIVQTVLDHIKKLDPRDISVVMEKDSDYQDLLEALLISHDIPYMASKDITKSETVRRFLNLIRISFYKTGTKIKDIRSLTKKNIAPEQEEYFLHSFDDPIKELMDDIPNKTFKELLDRFDEELKELEKQLEDIGFMDKKITLNRLNSLTYYLETFDIDIEKAERGVLLASPSTSTYIDRPIIFYLGMDSSWTPEPPTTPWIDQKEFDEKNIKDFQILLQNGQRRYFLVKNKKMNQTITPSFYFNEFTDETIESFRDLKHELNKKEIAPNPEPFKKPSVEAKQKKIKTMSQSALNTFAYCPKDRFFSELIKKPDNRYLRRGRVFHDLAEFLINYPDIHDKKDMIIDKMMDEMKPFLESYQLPNMKTRFEVGLQNLMDFLEEQKVIIHDPEGYEKKDTYNIFSELFNEPIKTRATEVSFCNEDIGAKGKVDLVLSQEHIVDHKTGSKKSLSKLMKDSELENIEKKPNFQAKMYIAHHRYHHSLTKINFTFYHLLDNERDVVSGSADPSDNIVNIVYYPKEFNDIVHEEMIFQWLKSSNNRRKVLGKLGYDDYLSFFEDKDIPELEKDELVAHPITAEFIDHCQNKIGPHKYVKKACISIMKKFVRFRDTRYFKKDIDLFESFLKKKIYEYKECRKNSFPVGDIDPHEIDNTDLVMI